MFSQHSVYRVIASAMLCFAFALTANGALSVTGNWVGITYGTTADVPNDYGTGQPETDLVGTNVEGTILDVPFFYTLYDDSAGLGNETLSFRTRHAGDDQADGFSQELIIGIMVDGDSTIDLYVGIDKQDGVYIAPPDDSANNSVGTIGIDKGNKSSYTSYGTDSAIYDWGMVSDYAGESGIEASHLVNTDLDGQDVKGTGKNGHTNEDYFLSFTVPLDQLIAIASESLPDDFTFDQSTGLRYVVATSTQSNSINQDVGGLSGTGDYGTDFNDIEVTDENGNTVDPFVPTTPTGSVVPEPTSSALLLIGLLAMFGVRRR